MSALVDTLAQPFAFAFMRNALLISLVIAVPSALLSCFLVLKGWSLMGDAISHAVLPGVVIAYMTGIPLALGAFAAGMICALGVGYLKENSRIKQDTVMGIVFSGMFGFGLVLYVKIQPEVHLDHILFGDMLGVSWGGHESLIVPGEVVLQQKAQPNSAHAFGIDAGRALHDVRCRLGFSEKLLPARHIRSGPCRGRDRRKQTIGRFHAELQRGEGAHAVAHDMRLGDPEVIEDRQCILIGEGLAVRVVGLGDIRRRVTPR